MAPGEERIERKHINVELKEKYEKKVMFDLDRTPQKLLQKEQTDAIKNDQELRRVLPFSAEGAVEMRNETVKSLVADAVESKIVSDSELEHDRKNKRFIRGARPFDSRIEPRSLDPAQGWQLEILKKTESVGMIVEKSRIHAVTDSIYQLDIGVTLSERFRLCPDEPFGDQPVIGVGTTFVLSDQLLMTAGHVFQGKLNDYLVVFGFEMINKVGSFQGLVVAKNIYTPKAIMHYDQDADLTVFSVSRPIDRPALKLSKQTRFARNTAVYMIGHPSGLPKKVALNASTQDQDDTRYFFTTLDSFQGNSGSPVFNMETNEVIGVLVSGMVDYQWNGTCNSARICSIPFCKGEKVTSLWSLPDVMELQGRR
jgi:S1-C subfamily serine protease